MKYLVWLTLPLLALLVSCGDDLAAVGAEGGRCRISYEPCDNGLVCDDGACSSLESGATANKRLRLEVPMIAAELEADGKDITGIRFSVTDLDSEKPHQGTIRLWVEPPGAGVLKDGLIELDGDGEGITTFVACNGKNRGCPSYATIRFADEDEPSDWFGARTIKLNGGNTYDLPGGPNTGGDGNGMVGGPGGGGGSGGALCSGLTGTSLRARATVNGMAFQEDDFFSFFPINGEGTNRVNINGTRMNTSLLDWVNDTAGGFRIKLYFGHDYTDDSTRELATIPLENRAGMTPGSYGPADAVGVSFAAREEACYMNWNLDGESRPFTVKVTEDAPEDGLLVYLVELKMEGSSPDCYGIPQTNISFDVCFRVRTR